MAASVTSSCPVQWQRRVVLSRPIVWGAAILYCTIPFNGGADKAAFEAWRQLYRHKQGSVWGGMTTVLARLYWQRLAAQWAATRGNKRTTRGEQEGNKPRKPCKSQEARPVPKRDLVQQGRRHRAARVHRHVGGSLSPSGFGMEGQSLDAVQDWIFGGNYHCGDLALKRRFPPKIDFRPCRDPGTNPTYGRPFISWVPGYACPVVPTDR